MGLRAVEKVRFARGTTRKSRWCAVDHRVTDWVSRSSSCDEEFEVVIMIAGCDRRDAWVGLSPDLKTITSEPTVGKGNTINENEMALFSECMQSCAQKVLDTADIVRDAIYRQLRCPASFLSTLCDRGFGLSRVVLHPTR